MIPMECEGIKGDLLKILINYIQICMIAQFSFKTLHNIFDGFDESGTTKLRGQREKRN
jgi:hypothetical protein